MTKVEALKSVLNGKAKFIEDEHIIKDYWIHTYSYEGQKFTVNVFTLNKEVDDEPENIEFIN